MKDNKLIAEFMGISIDGEFAYIKDEGSPLEETMPINQIEYHNSWDWLIPVVEKCLTTDEKTDGQHYFINDALLTCNIEVVYDRVVEFIKDCEENE